MFKSLRETAAELDEANLFGLTPEKKICVYKPFIVSVLEIVKSIIPPIFWGVIVRGQIEVAILILKELCPKEPNQSQAS